MKMKSFLAALVATVVFCAIGCGGPQKPSDLPDLYPVKLTIIQDGQPLEGATVYLVDTTNTCRFTVGYQTDAKGIADLKTDGKFPGCPAGNFKVVINKKFMPEMPTGNPPSDPEERAEFDRKIKELNDQVAETVDVKFTKASTTPEVIEVTSAGLEKTIDVGEKVHVLLNDISKSSGKK